MEAVRVDKWLWAARFMKTRGLAADAVKGGRVHVNGRSVKASKEVAVGDRLDITIGDVRRVVVVAGVSDKRGPAPVAQLLYEETPESIAVRERAAELRRLAGPAPVTSNEGGRPTKRDRRVYDRDAAARRGD